MTLPTSMNHPFPEEPLNLSPSEGGGYYPAVIHQKLNGDKYKVIRKLGYGPRSSTWLVLTSDNLAYFVVKIFTVTASDHAKTVEIPILKTVNNLNPSLLLPRFHESFWVKSGAGSHICFVMNPVSTSFRDLQRDAENQRFPVHAVRQIVWGVARSLKGLHAVKIMHGRTYLTYHDLSHLNPIENPLLEIKAENLFFLTATQVDRLKPVLDSEPAPSIRKIKKFTTVISQPLKQGFKWNNKMKDVINWSIHLDGFGHGKAFPHCASSLGFLRFK